MRTCACIAHVSMFGDVVAKRTVVYYGRAGDKRAAM